MLTTCSVVNEIFSKIDHHIQEDDLLQELNMSALPLLCENFVELIEYLVSKENMHISAFQLLRDSIGSVNFMSFGFFCSERINRKIRIKLPSYCSACWSM